MLAIPAGIYNDTNVPFALGLIQKAGREDLLFRYGSAIEDLVKGRRKPTFKKLQANNWMYVGSPPS